MVEEACWLISGEINKFISVFIDKADTPACRAGQRRIKLNPPLGAQGNLFGCIFLRLVIKFNRHLFMNCHRISDSKAVYNLS